jgi:hypothetical protein
VTLSWDCQSKDLLISSNESAFVSARDLLSSLLTRGRGELLLRLGSHPARDALFNNAPLDDVEGRRGRELTQQQLDDAVQRFLAVAGDIGAVVRTSPYS